MVPLQGLFGKKGYLVNMLSAIKNLTQCVTCGCQRPPEEDVREENSKKWVDMIACAYTEAEGLVEKISGVRPLQGRNIYSGPALEQKKKQ